MKMRVCYFGTYRAAYERNQLMIHRLRMKNIEVVECHVTLWHGMEDREQVALGGWKSPAFWWRVFSAYTQLFRQYLHVGDYDVMFVGYPGQPDLPLAWLLSRLKRRPLVWDVMMSIYLIAKERGLDHKSPLSLRFIRWIEKIGFKLADLYIVDTQEYARWYIENYSVDEGKIRLLPLGADDRIFKPTSARPKTNGCFQCLYYGTYIHNHGVPYIVEAARLLQNDPSIQFEFIGRGPEYERIHSLVSQYKLTNITFIEWLEPADLVQHIADADLVLATFGNTPQALLTMQHKIHGGLAMARPVLNGDSPVMRSTLINGKQIYLCERESGEAIAAAIRDVKAQPDLLQAIAQGGYSLYQEKFTLEITARMLQTYLLELTH